MKPEGYVIRPSTLNDLPRMRLVFAEARTFMASVGNSTQWGDGYPTDDILTDDIRRGVSYVMEHNGKVVGTFAFIPGLDPTYAVIEQGHWLDDVRPYATLHRLASLTDSHGIADACLEWCAAKMDNLRVDTHQDNKVLQHILLTRGFTYCGIIYVRNHSPRLAFQRILTRKS